MSHTSHRFARKEINWKKKNFGANESVYGKSWHWERFITGTMNMNHRNFLITFFLADLSCPKLFLTFHQSFYIAIFCQILVEIENTTVTKRSCKKIDSTFLINASRPFSVRLFLSLEESYALHISYISQLTLLWNYTIVCKIDRSSFSKSYCLYVCSKEKSNEFNG